MTPRTLNKFDTANLIRKELKREFPGQRFSVRLGRAGWNTVLSIAWSGGPTREEVRYLCDKFRATDFNLNNDDSTTRREPLLFDGQPMLFGVDSISYYRAEPEATS